MRQKRVASRAPTVRDVARLAGVSTSTVSKHLNGQPYVAAKTAEKIQDAISELKYEPHGPGRSLASGRTKLIGVVVASIRNPFYAELVSTLDSESRGRGYGVVLGTTDDEPGREQFISRALMQGGVDGIVVASAHGTDRELEVLQERRTPLVLASRHVLDLNVDFVTVDGRMGASLAVEHLLTLGHERIAYVGGPQSVLQFQERFAGYRASLEDNGHPVHDARIIQNVDGLVGGRKATTSLLALPAMKRPTAIFAASDYIAFGVMAEARARNVNIPKELSVIGFDGLSLGEAAAVPLTTIDGRIADIGRSAVRLLINRLENPDSNYPPQQERLMPFLQLRESTTDPFDQTGSPIVRSSAYKGDRR